MKVYMLNQILWGPISKLYWTERGSRIWDRKFDVYCDFYYHLARVILLENEINGTLIFDKGSYTFIVKDNSELLIMSVRYSLLQEKIEHSDLCKMEKIFF